MNLKNNQITIRELLSEETSRAVLAKHFAAAIDTPAASLAGNLTLQSALLLGRRYLSGAQMQEILRELENC